jgi:hypothetical protein
MIRKLPPLFLVLLLTACSTIKHNSANIQTEGIGHDCTSALKQAKLKAAEDYKGTFVNSKRRLVNDRMYSESVDEYSGGVIESYKVKSTSGGSPCVVTIEAKIAPDSKSIEVNSETSLELGSVERHINQQNTTREMLRKLIHRPELIKVESSTIKPVVYDDGSIGMAVKFTKIVPSPKWMTDLELFLSVHGTKHTYRERNPWADIGKGLLALTALPVLIPIAIVISPFTDNKTNKPNKVNPGDQFSLCFPGKDEVNCYQGWAADAVYEKLNSAAIVAIMNKEGAPMAGFPVRGGSISLNQHFEIKAPLVDDQNRTKSRFDLVSAKPINIEGSLNLANNWVSDGYDLQFRIKFN